MSKNTKFLIGLFIVLFLAGGIVILAAPVGTVLRSVIPETNNTYYLGTTSPRTYWANTYTQILTITSGTATTTINAGDTIDTFAYPFTGIGPLGQATSSTLYLRSTAGIFASSTSMLASTTILGSFNIGTLTATSGTSFLQALTLGTKLPNSELANSSVTLNTTSPLGGGGAVSLGGSLTFTCSTCATGTINSGTANRIAVYSGATTFDSSNLIAALGSGSTTIPSNLTVTSIYASSTVRITGALTLDTALTVANGGTGATSITGLVLGNGTSAFTAYGGATCTNQFIRIFSASGAATCATVSLTADITGTLAVGNGGTGATTFTANGVLYGNTASAIQVTAQGPANSVLTANAGAPSFSASPTITNLTVTASTTFSGASSLFTFQGTTYFGGTVGIATTSPTFGLTVGNPNVGVASSSPLAPECRWVVAGSFTLDLSQCVNSSITAAANITITFSNIRAGVAGSVNLCQDGTGGRTWSWDNSLVRFMNASSSGLTATANRCNLVGFKGVFATGTVPLLFMIPSDAF